jgi:small subunit ribosomal protein S20
LKRIRSSEKRRQRNRIVRGSTRTAVRKARATIHTGKVQDAETAVLSAISALDRAAEKGVIHKNNAARRKSRLMRQLNQIRAAAG